MKNVVKLFLMLTLVGLPSQFNFYKSVVHADEPQVINEPKGKLGYRKVVIPTTRYSNVYGVNSKLELVGLNRESKCLEVFDTKGVVKRSGCFASSDINFDKVKVFISESGNVAGSYETGEYPNQAYSIFRLGLTGGIEILSKPSSIQGLNFATVTGINDQGTISGFYSDTELEDISYQGSAIAFSAQLGASIVPISPAGSLGTVAGGITDNVVFGEIRRALANNAGTSVTPWSYNLNTNVSSEPAAKDEFKIQIVGLDRSGSMLVGKYQNMVDVDGKSQGFRIKVYDKNSEKLSDELLDTAMSLTPDGFRTLSDANYETITNMRVEHNGFVSDSLGCAIKVGEESPFFTGMAQSGVALFGGDGYSSKYKPVVFIPSERNELPNYCLHVNFEIPAESKRLVRTKSSCNAGYQLIEKHLLSDGTTVPVQLRVFDGNGDPVAGVNVLLNLQNDGKPFKFVGHTDRKGRIKLSIPFLKKSRIGYCSLVDVEARKKGFNPATTSVADPDGGCGSCV